MGNPIILPSFAAGELAPSMYGRVDLAKYHVGAALLRNYFVDYRGGASSRTGTSFVGQCKDSTQPNRLIPFQFNTQQTYALVFGAGSQYYSATVTGNSYDSPSGQIIVEVTSTSGLTSGERVVIAGTLTAGTGGGARPTFDGTYSVTVIDSTHLLLQGSTYVKPWVSGGTATASGGSLRFVTNGGYVLEIGTAITGISQANPGVVSDPGHGYSNGDLVLLQGIVGMTQMNQRFGVVANVTTNTYTLTDMYGNPINTVAYSAYVSGGTAARVYTLTTPYDASDLALLKYTQSADVMTLVHPSYTPQTLTRSGNADWALAAITFQPASAPPASSTVNETETGTQYPNTVYSYQVTAVVNGVESLPTPPCTTAGIPALSQNVGAFNVVSWSSVTDATVYNIYRTQENLGTNPPAGALFGYIGSANPATTNTFNDDNILPDFTNCPPQAYDPFTVAGNPGCVCYYQQRQVFAGMSNAPEQMDFSKSGDFFNMDFSIPSKDDDNIEITIASQQVNAIEFMIPMQSLLVLTSSGAWAVSGGTSGAALTPSQVQALPQAYNGCSSYCPPIAINYDILYVQARGSIVRDLAYNFYVNLYTGTDITMMSNHLFFGHQILEWAYAEEPFKLIWCVREDGILLSLTYLKEQDVMAWAHHDTEGLFKSVCSVIEGEENVVYVIVERFIQGQYLQYIERFASRQLGGDPTIGLAANPSLAWCVDAGLQYPLNAPAATLTPVETDAIPIISAVNLIAGGQNYSTQTVINITDSTGTGGIISPVIVGGVITGADILEEGIGWTNPTLTVFDPTGAGSGAALQTILASPVTMNASAAVFGSTQVGDVVRINNGMGYVMSIPNPSQIVVNVVNALTGTWPASAGTWSVTTPAQTISGLDHLDGQTVSVLADGSVAPAQVVVNGAITLDRAYSSITVGLPFTCQLQSLYIDVQEQGGTIQSKRKTIPAVTVRVQDSRGVFAGPTFNTLIPIKERTTEAMGQPIQLFTGDQRVVLPANYNVPGQICVQVTDPLPSTILALIPEIVVGDN
ncbi:ubiquitin-activating E1 FCCH domain-containing protein [Paraburkholderia phenazinium]|uniref:Ubiquitin-activating enzyme E1 FCCH domain-containing protein n=1 Tax=Paraburkholderia phenazinium TaxID=60549 RepID=A0A1N6KPD7_9BURK|nr:ubiquitin-activating E1 FCCH domain-containing protein [Paraburkholderia phenazinium]SIO58411.1 hypothetical protein SAMN05444165_4135 [Paraburkholderia phenazinium]